ncbi:DsbA family protein [Streptomyces clavuligerus]|uniref:DSBA oxidoreductase n=1 Tax=Streptomyces clavuligerus TaxID=1901 RepID=B5GXR6_STRCL|nr:DsbA family protein [Streptomyces clavuligerus]ANW20643.1 disulfide bond formation protein DsbA [Streptomyces clavuligerus]AXU15268.1 DsbA family protein [Streptomyces clavuligerus]EDY51112.1 DSBA oxidoreductase [Streptomyces clavuligerus]EFG06355.1 DSBA oxidoreductase [Streptomyces clavuligerus]MBY6305346.1 DsbA family protein [Streptomyces clavuligerus]
MSARNSKANKAAARERIRQQQEAQAKKDRTRRQLIVVGSTLGGLALVGGIAFGVKKASEPSAWDAAKNAKSVTAPANTTGTNGTELIIGKPEAKKTLELYEDSRCPSCAVFEQQVGKVLEKDVEDGKYKIKYIGATFIDNLDNGEGSKNALSALGAAVNVSPEAFLGFKAALYSAEMHPKESKDSFAEDSYLLKVADKVPALKDNAQFEKDVKEGTFDAWAMKMSATFEKSGIEGTPSLRMDGKLVTTEGSKNAPQTPEQFRAAVDKALKG